ncbi:hypothetical protein [Jeotgalibacillus salarius]|uniref:Uncharacterized protein n=1 Tax=Jeotgalibacillus salarius TaxID=546023 RepID=A0A4Y8LE10_9BACL|nr:hypothetical protein [Jeotgalibacillus salarius]TFE00556.1 hypothetical protein E2626_11310 [Jeotgalibacillus salarius]
MSKENRIKKWEKVRGKGKKNYILYYGIIGWGVTTGLLFFLIGEIFDHGLSLSQYFTGDWISLFSKGLVSFMVGGLLFGYITWGMNESYYHDKHIKNKL